MIRSCPSCGRRNRIPGRRLADRARCGSCGTQISPVDVPVHVTSEAEFDEILRDSALPVVVDFWADWCAPCRMVAPELEKLAGLHAGRVLVAKVDTEALQSVAARYGIRSIPTLILYRHGTEVQRVTGAMRADQLASALGL